jgi:hypothetical protein
MDNGKMDIYDLNKYSPVLGRKFPLASALNSITAYFEFALGDCYLSDDNQVKLGE